MQNEITDEEIRLSVAHGAQCESRHIVIEGNKVWIKFWVDRLELCVATRDEIAETIRQLRNNH